MLRERHVFSLIQKKVWTSKARATVHTVITSPFETVARLNEFEQGGNSLHEIILGHWAFCGLSVIVQLQQVVKSTQREASGDVAP